ncbi:MAG: hypothetical protein GY749_14070 [Desulfobacteraceae bacterium]|nr:hypothetical protein [Desulfobacteraceae bacterium]
MENFNLRITEALLSCSSVRDRGTRDAIVEELPHDIRMNIPRHDFIKVDVLGIVGRCMDFNGGLKKLIEIVRFFEGDSECMKIIDDLLNQKDRPEFSGTGSFVENSSISGDAINIQNNIFADMKDLLENPNRHPNCLDIEQGKYYRRDVLHTNVHKYLNNKKRCLISGKPGSGKTALARGVGFDLINGLETKDYMVSFFCQ